MSKITLTTIGSLTQNPTSAQTNINANFATIQTAMDNTLSRDGTAPDQMLSNLDMNNLQIINLPAPATANSPARLQDLVTLNGGGTIANFPVGGTTNQVLAKNSNTNYDTKWTNSVTSVGLALPADFTISNSPVTTTGTLTAVFANTPTGTGGFVRATSPTLATATLTSPTINTGILTSPSISTATLTGTTTHGVAGSAAGPIAFANATSGTVTVTPPTGALGSVTNTLQAVTDTFVYKATTDTLTNKTISGSSNTLSNVALSSLASQAAYSMVANFTAGSAAPTATANLSGLVSKATPTVSDLILIHDAAASGQLKTSTLANLVFNTAAGNFQPTAPGGTGSTTGVMMGIGSTCTITPTYSGRLYITLSGFCANGTASDGVGITLYTGTGTAPVNGAAITGTARSNVINAAANANSANLLLPFSITVAITGLTVGTAVWIDAALKVLTGGAASMNGLTCAVMEF